jgi:Na+/glutamate symporter
MGGVVGLVIGFVRGLTVYAPTAWAAAFEVAIPCAAVGLVVGLALVGLQATARRPATLDISQQPQRDQSKDA